MANICDFSMMVKGKKENIEQFVDMMEQKELFGWVEVQL